MQKAVPIIVVVLLVGACVALLLMLKDSPLNTTIQNAPPNQMDLVQSNNRAVALLGQFKYAEAEAIFADLVKAYPENVDLKVNHAIAILNRQLEGDELVAIDVLRAALADDPEHLRAKYTLAILLGRNDGIEKAKQLFLEVAAADEHDAFAAYRAGAAVEREDPDGAVEWYRKAAALDPYFRTAFYRLTQTRTTYDRSAEIEQALEIFNRLNGHPQAREIKDGYGRMGVKAEALAINAKTQAPSPLPDGPVFDAARPLIELPDGVTWNAGASGSITVCDLDGDDDFDLFVPRAIIRDNAPMNAVLLREADGGFQLGTAHPLAGVPSVNCALWGDYDNDGRTDVYLCRNGANQLWRFLPNGNWMDVTDSTGVTNRNDDTVDGAFVDADHDGDLDIFCVNADGPNELLNNNLDGTFRLIAKDQGIAGRGGGSRQVLFGDLDHDRDADIIVINNQPPHDVFINDRVWAYHQAESMDALRNADIAAAVLGDLDADGRNELYTINNAGGIAVATEDGKWMPRLLTVQPTIAENATGFGLAIADVDGDGARDLIGASSDGWWTIRFDADGQAGDVHSESSANVSAWTLYVDPAAGNGPSFVAFTDEFRHWPAGPGRHDFATLLLRGKDDPTVGPPPARSNASGIGAEIAVRFGSNWTTASSFRAHSGPGQSLQPIAFGLEGKSQLDFVKVEWSDGVFQSEAHDISPGVIDGVELPPHDFTSGHLEVVVEKQRVSSSCPVLFVWNGKQYEFVSDLLGVGGIGYFVAPGEYAPPRPWEHFLLPADVIQPKDDRFVLKLSEPMEEATYLDFASLVAYELPPGWKMTLDERMSILGPEPTGEPRYYRRELQPARAFNDRGENVLREITIADGIAADTGALDARFIGLLAREHILTIEFDEAIVGESGTPMLVADGWIEYPYSQTMFAAWQANVQYEAPTLEARNADGEWIVVHEQFGYPAGMPRQMSIELPDLPAGTNALRLRTNQEIYWDRLFIAYAEPCPDAQRYMLPLAIAELKRSGFAMRVHNEHHRPEYDYARRPAANDMRHLTGRYTAYGDVRELVRSSDDALAIIGPGEEVHFEFDVDLPEIRDGWSRRLVIETVGWCKDMDLFTHTGESLDPIPSSAEVPDEAHRQRLHEQYNTRYESGF